MAVAALQHDLLIGFQIFAGSFRDGPELNAGSILGHPLYRIEKQETCVDFDGIDGLLPVFVTVILHLEYEIGSQIVIVIEQVC